MPKKMTEEMFNERCEKVGAQAVGGFSSYKGARTKMPWICSYCGKEFEALPYSIWDGNTKSCGCQDPSRPHTEETFNEKCKAVGAQPVGGFASYKGTDTKMPWICNYCGKQFEARPNHIWTGNTTSCGCRNGGPLTEKQFNANCEKVGAQAVGGFVSYKGADTKMPWICNYCGKEFEAQPSNIWNGHTKSCGCQDPSRPHTEETFNERCKAVGAQPVGGFASYKGTDTKMPWICSYCGKEFEALPYSIWNGNTKSCGCQGQGTPHTEETFNERCKAVGAQPVGGFASYKNNNTKMPWICNYCGKEFMAIPAKIWNGTTTSCGCLKSKGNNTIKECLLDLKEPHDPEHKFVDCKNKIALRFDFYLPRFNMCIEYQGEQHYEDTFKGHCSKPTHHNDKIKKKYCEKNNIKLYTIPYTYFDKLPEIIEDLIVRNKLWEFSKVVKKEKNRKRDNKKNGL